MEKKRVNGFGIAALICGILGCVGAFIPIITYFAWFIAVIGIIMGGVGIHKSKVWGTGGGLAVGGLVTGIIGTIVGLIGLLVLVLWVYIAAWWAGIVSKLTSNISLIGLFFLK